MLRILIKLTLNLNYVGTCLPGLLALLVTLWSDDSGAEELQQRLQGQQG